MDIEGTYTLQASPEDVWQALMDPQVLRRAIPGVEQLELLDEHAYDIVLHIKHAPLVGLYHGQIRITSTQYPSSYSFSVEGSGRQSKISGQGTIHLHSHGSNTIIAYHGTLNLGKPGTLLPPPVIRGTAKLLLQQFFTALSEYLRTLYPASMEESINEVDMDTSMETLEITEEPQAPVVASAFSAFLYKLVRTLRLGRGDPLAEAQWVRRMRRIGIVVTLLFLVWIGTRLPWRPGGHG